MAKDRLVANQKTTTYVYDSANQLIRENNQAAGKTWVWTYDNAGNILKKMEYTYTTGTLGGTVGGRSYTYGNSGWKDLLTNYNGKSISYDTIGNPLSDGTWTYTWQEGRKLATMSNGSTAWTFTYDANGMRTKRTNGSVTYNYVYHGDQLEYMSYGDTELHFSYDASGKPLSVTDENKKTYYYVLNLQGDVVAIVDSSGAQVVSYRYDAYGRLLAATGTMGSTLGQLNPIRYRGYVYDRETGLYYLQSRYYNPEMGRFINADSQLNQKDGMLGFNIFAYCYNNPIMYSDPDGHAPKWWQSILIGVGVIAVAALATAAIVYTGGGAAAFFATAGQAALGGLKIAAVAGTTAGIVRAGKTAMDGGTIEDVGKSLVLGFSDGFLAGSIYGTGSMMLGAGSYRMSGSLNDGYGWSSGSYIGGYQTPKTPGVSLITHLGGTNGGRSFGVDLDIYNGLHFHTNKFGIGKKNKWIKAHHWYLAPIGIGVGVGLSDGWSEW